MNHQFTFLGGYGNLFVPAIFSAFLILPGISPAKADNVITSGTTLKVLAGTTLVSSESLVIKSGATLSNAGTVILKKDLTNENPSANPIGPGAAELSGATAQTISGRNVMAGLTINNVAGVIVGGNTVVNGILALVNGKVTLGGNNLLLGPSATITGTPSSAAMIIVTGSGELRKEFAAGFAGIFTFPVGDDTGTPEYSPVTLTFTGGTFAAGNYVGVKLVNDKYPDGDITGNYLKRYWAISQSGITGLSCNAAFQYIAEDVMRDESKLSCTRVNPLPWTTYALTNATSHLLSANGITSFGSFTGLKSSTTPANQQLANIDIPNGTAVCYDATQVLTVAGSGAAFLIENGGNVTLVAGNKILLLDGVRVNSGGYLDAHITTTSAYCGSMANQLVENPAKGLLSMDENPQSQWIKIYPNPTTDYIILELNQGNDPPVAYVAIYNMNG
ncbi:MAG: T9SS type A sorting domain-containing protein, partial [Bacteroidales bacterium]|nr:T9SS type A sorting domain-containing protein [Bacteroidales bacterium]